MHFSPFYIHPHTKADFRFLLLNEPISVALSSVSFYLFQILKYVLEVTSVKKKFAELTVGGKDKETFPDLKFSFDVSHSCSDSLWKPQGCRLT